MDFEITRVDCISGDVLVFPTSIIAKVLFALVRICSFIGTLEYKHLSGGLRGVDRKIVPRITVWHHEACRVMPDCDREGRIFLSTPYNHDRFFFFSCTPFISERNFLIAQSLTLLTSAIYCGDLTVAFNDVITFSDVNLTYDVCDSHNNQYI